MSRHRCRPRRAWPAAVLAAAGILPGLIAPPAARAQTDVNVFVNDAFVITGLNTDGPQGAFHFVNPKPNSTPVQFLGPVAAQDVDNQFPLPWPQNFGDISNDPQINFENNYDASPAFPDRCIGAPLTPNTGHDTGTPAATNNNGSELNGNKPPPLPGPKVTTYPPGDNGYNVCNSQVYLCTQICATGGTTTAPISIDKIEFDIFRYVDGANPLDPGTTPPLRTFFVDSPGEITSQGAPGNCVPTKTLDPWFTNDASPAGNCWEFTDGVPAVDGRGGCFPADLFSPSSTAITTALCVLWDGAQAVQGNMAKINGSYGFRVTTLTNQQGQSGNIQITDIKAYPFGATYDGTANVVSQKPIVVNVTDVHTVNSTPTVVGRITGVAAEPYNFTWRQSKTAQMYITVNNGIPLTGGTCPDGTGGAGSFCNVRDVLAESGEQEPGEGTLTTTTSLPLVDGSSWDGRDNNGSMTPPGNYLAVFQANSFNQFTAPQGTYQASVPGGRAPMFGDLSNPTTYSIALDPLQITDIAVTPLLGGSTSLAVITYQLTEPSTVYVDIYAPGTTFCPDPANGIPLLNELNNATPNPTDPLHDPNFTSVSPPAKHFGANSDHNLFCNSFLGLPTLPIRSIQQVQPARTSVLTFWDGRDKNGTLVNSGDYVFVIYASLPSQAATEFYNDNLLDPRVWTSSAKVGFISVVRSLIGITQISPTSSVIGSSPAVAGLNPFSFSYQLSRPALVSMNIFDQSGNNLIKTLVSSETRAGGIGITEVWPDGTDNNGNMVSSGTYLVQLTAADAAFPANISTTTAQFPVDLFRITDVASTGVGAVAGDTATVSYQMSQPMFIAWNIYPPGSTIVNSVGPSGQFFWPPCPNQSPPGACTTAPAASPGVVTPAGTPASPVITFFGARPGRLKITETWDARDPNGIFVPDGQYVWVLTAQSTTTPMHYPSDRTFGTVTVARASVGLNANVVPTVPALFNSSNTITLDPFSILYTVTRESSVTVQIINTSNPPAVLATVVAGGIREPGIQNTDVWDGRDINGSFLPFTPGGTPYIVRVLAQDVASSLTIPATAQITINYDPLRIYDTAVTPIVTGGDAVIAYQVSEPMTVSIKIYKPKTTFNGIIPTPPDATSLVRFITGVRPPRVAIKDTWDGTDFTGTKLKDGDYMFVLVGSTDPAAIDPATANVIFPTELADDRLVFDIPISVGQSLNPQADLENNSFIYPNPVSGPTATFQIYSPFQAHVTLKLFTMSGRLVMAQDFGQVPPSFQSGPITFAWNKVNQGGRAVARGVYYALIRVEQVLDGTTVLQTVKKVLIP